MINIDPRGIDKIRKEFKALESGLKAKALRSGMVSSIAPIKKAMKANIRSDEGVLAASIGHKSLSKTAKGRLGYKPDQVVLIAGATKKVAENVGGVMKKRGQGYKAHWLERGTKPHVIKAPQKKALKIGSGFASAVSHPGTPATRFMARALDSGRPQMQQRFYHGLQRFMEKKRRA